MHCWHQVVRVKKAQLDDHYGDISVDTQKARGVYKEWLEMTRPADSVFAGSHPAALLDAAAVETRA